MVTVLSWKNHSLIWGYYVKILFVCFICMFHLWLTFRDTIREYNDCYFIESDDVWVHGIVMGNVGNLFGVFIWECYLRAV